MARVLVVPDSHLNIGVIEDGMQLADKLMCDRVILLGDYFDDWGAQQTQYYDMRDYLKDLLRKNHGRVIPLIGNHELSYLGYPCSGYDRNVEHVVRGTVEYDHRFVPCYSCDRVLYSHAGVVKEWVLNNKVLPLHMIKYHIGPRNGAETIEDKILGISDYSKYAQAGPARGGHSAPSPMWADMTELIADPLGEFKQVVGHTPVEQIEKIGNCYFCDVFSNGNVSDEYLMVTDGEAKIVHYNEVVLGEIL